MDAYLLEIRKSLRDDPLVDADGHVNEHYLRGKGPRIKAFPVCDSDIAEVRTAQPQLVSV
jgi:hypothetical protein